MNTWGPIQILNKTTNTGHTTNFNYSTRHGMLSLRIILFIGPWSKLLTTELGYLIKVFSAKCTL